MKKIQITLPEATDTKATEIKVLEKLHTNLKGTGTYLESLFTFEFAEWVRYQIANDWLPNIYEELNAERNNHSVTKAEARLDVERLEKEVDDLKEDLNTYRAVVDEQNEKLIAITNEANNWQEAFESAREVQYDIASRLCETEIRYLQQEEEIIRLKAKLYDLTNGDQS